MGKYIDQADGENVLSAQTIAAIYTDGNTGAINQTALNSVIDDAEGEVDSYMIGYTGPYPVPEPTDRLLKLCAKDFFIAFSFRRDPAYVRQFGDDPRSYGTYTRAVQRMARIQAATQKLPDQPAPGTTPYNVGGVTVSGGPRLMVAGVDGCQNGDGF